MQAGPHKQEPSRVERSEIDALVALVKVDYEHTLGFIDGVVRVSTSIRTIATAGWFALIAAAVQTQHGWLAILATVGVVVFGLQDAYHGWLYAEARKRAFEIERLLDGYYKYLQRQSQPGAGTDLLKGLHNHRFGQRSRVPLRGQKEQASHRGAADPLRRSGWRLWAEQAQTAVRDLGTIVAAARPKLFYRFLYPPLVAAGLIVAVLVFENDDPSPPEAVRACLVCRDSPSQIRSDSAPLPPDRR